MTPAVPTTTAAQVGDAFLLDVREDDEWAAGHAPQAVHVPLQQVPDRLGELPAGQQVVVICRVGGRSAQAVAWLLHQGVDAVNVEGGMFAWEAAGLPVVAADGPGRIV